METNWNLLGSALCLSMAWEELEHRGTRRFGGMTKGGHTLSTLYDG